MGIHRFKTNIPARRSLAACLMVVASTHAASQSKVEEAARPVQTRAPSVLIHQRFDDVATRTQPVQLRAPVIEIVDPTAPAKTPNGAASAAQGVAPTTVEPTRSAANRSRSPGKPSPQTGPIVGPDIHLYIGESRLIRGLKSSRVVVGTDTIMTAVVLDNREVMLFGNGPGSTTLQVWDTANTMRTFRVNVKGTDTGKLLKDVQALLSDIPNARVHAVGDKVVIDGRDLGDENLHRIAALTKQFDSSVINLTDYQREHGGWDQMVILDVKVVEFKNRERVRDLGIRWASATAGPTFGIAGDIHASRLRNGDRYYVQPVPGVADVARPLAPFRTFFGLASTLASMINLMATDGEAIILSEPQLASRHGRKASMNVGGRIPFAVVAGLGAVEVRYERFGVILEMTPWIGKDGMIQAKIKAEVSDRDTSLDVNGLPGFRERMVETVFNVNDGETMVLSGLVQRLKSTATQKVPGLGDVPVVGALFRNNHDEVRESEVIIFVTPKIVDARHKGVRDAIQSTEQRTNDYLGPIHLVPGSESRP